MPDDIVPAGGATPPPVAEPPKPPPNGGETPQEIKLTSDQLKARLDETREAGRRALIKEFGFEKQDDLKTALGEYKTLKTSSLSEKEKLEASIKELAPQAAEGKVAKELVKLMVDEQFAKLPDAVQKAIDDTAQGDAAKRYELMRVLAAANGAAPPPAPPLPNGPANKGPAAPPPPPSGAPTKFQEWEAMKTRHPMLGDVFYQTNRIEIERSRPSAP